MYTYDDYLKKKQEYGFADGEISDADDRLAQSNPDAGISLLGYKNDWKTATNDSARAFAHAGAEDIRKNWGGYSGGESGGSFALTGMPEYEDPYEGAIQAQIKRMNREFTYDPATDPNTKYYTDMYRREGDRAMKDTLGAIAGTTGGIPSSYASAAAAQQRNYYAQQLTDKYPELYQKAYENFLSEYTRAQQTANTLQGQSDTAYGRFIDQKTMEYQQEQDRAAKVQQEFENAYLMRQYEDDLNLRIRELDTSEQQAAKELALAYAQLAQSGQQADAELRYRYAALSQQAKEAVQDYAYKYAALSENARQSDLDREHQAMLALIEEELARDQMAADNTNAAWDRALAAAEMGDLSKLAELGVDTKIYQKLIDEQLGITSGEEIAEKDITEEDVMNAIAEQKKNAVTGTEDYSIAGKAPGDVVTDPLVTPNTISNARRDAYFSDKPYTEKYRYFDDYAESQKADKAQNIASITTDPMEIVRKVKRGQKLTPGEQQIYDELPAAYK